MGQSGREGGGGARGRVGGGADRGGDGEADVVLCSRKEVRQIVLLDVSWNLQRRDSGRCLDVKGLDHHMVYI